MDRSGAKVRAQSAIDAASMSLERGAMTEREWHLAVTNALAEAYLAEDDPRWQSGFDGDATLWRQARELVLDAVPHAGSFLDVGSANGHLMECLETWARERGLRLDVHGLELNEELVAASRRRLPALADHIYRGNVVDWIPPRRFAYVRTGLEYVPATGRATLVRRLLQDVVETGGRLLVGPINADQREETAAAFRIADAESHETSAADRNGKRRFVVWTPA